MSDGSHLSIGEVLAQLQAEFPDVTISKIRFLESQGLVNPERTPSGYRKFYPADVERMLERHPDVAQAAVVPIDDDIKGQKPVAFIIAKGGQPVDAEEIKQFALANAPAVLLADDLGQRRRPLLPGERAALVQCERKITADGALAVTVFALPLIIVAGMEGEGASPVTLTGVLDDSASLTAILREHGACGFRPAHSAR